MTPGGPSQDESQDLSAATLARWKIPQASLGPLPSLFAGTQIDGSLADLHRELFIESNPIPVKWALERMGRIPGGIRLPLTPLSESARPAVEAALRRARVL